MGSQDFISLVETWEEFDLLDRLVVLEHEELLTKHLDVCLNLFALGIQELPDEVELLDEAYFVFSHELQQLILLLVCHLFILVFHNHVA